MSHRTDSFVSCSDPSSRLVLTSFRFVPKVVCGNAHLACFRVAGIQVMDTSESDTEVASDHCSVCDTPRFSTSSHESCSMFVTPEFATASPGSCPVFDTPEFEWEALSLVHCLTRQCLRRRAQDPVQCMTRQNFQRHRLKKRTRRSVQVEDIGWKL